MKTQIIHLATTVPHYSTWIIFRLFVISFVCHTFFLFFNCLWSFSPLIFCCFFSFSTVFIYIFHLLLVVFCVSVSLSIVLGFFPLVFLVFTHTTGPQAAAQSHNLTLSSLKSKRLFKRAVLA